MARLSPTEQRIYDVLNAEPGRWLRSAVIRDRAMPDRHANNIRVHIRLMRLKGVPIESDVRGPQSRGYRLEAA